MLRSLLAVLFSLLAVGCTCQQQKPFRKFWRQHIKKTYNWVLADSEAAKYQENETEARAYLRTLRGMDSPYAVANQLQTDGFHWHAESVDFTSYAWVTIARKRGDCDDFMCLWEAVLKYKGRTKRVSVSSKEDRAHAMLMFYPEGSPTVIYLLSNSRVLGSGRPGDEDRLIRLFYGDKTDCYILY